MREVPVTAQAGISSQQLSALSRVLRNHTTLQSVLDWCQAQTPPADLVDVVVQDEFTHDIVLGLGGGLFAVYDTT